MISFSVFEKALPLSMFLAPGRPVRPKKRISAQGLLPIFSVALGEQTSPGLPAPAPASGQAKSPSAVYSFPVGPAASASAPIPGARTTRPGAREGRLPAAQSDSLAGPAVACSRPADRNAADGSIDRSLSVAEASESVAALVPAAEDLFGWVEKNIKQIRGHARKYLAYSPYEIDEFVGQAYETALRAREACLQKGEPADYVCFEKMFWASFRIACLGLTYTHGKPAVISHEEYQESGDDDAPATKTPAELLIDGEEILEDSAAAGPVTGPVGELTPAQKRAAARQVLELMTPRERLAWEYSLAGKTRRQAARKMGITRNGVMNLLRRGLKRAKRLAVPADFRSVVVRRPRRPKTALLVSAQHYLPIIEKRAGNPTASSRAEKSRCVDILAQTARMSVLVRL